MRALRPIVASSVLASLMACSLTGPVTPPSTRPTRGPSVRSTPKATPTPSPRPTAGATPTPAPTPTGTPTPAPLAKLLKPAAATRTLSGRIMVDAAYAVAQGGTLIADAGGSLVSNAGASATAVAVGGAKLDAAGRLVANNGGAIAVSGGGNVAALGAAGAVGEIAGGILIANNGGALMGAPAQRRLQQAPLTAGAQLAAAGMLISVVSLFDHEYLPLGEGPDGQPIYAVYSNAAGEYEVHVPAEAAGNVLVVAAPPGAVDPRLAYNVVNPPGATAAIAVDDKAAATTRYLRTGFTGRMANILQAPDAVAIALEMQSVTSPAGKAVMQAGLQRVADAAKAAGVDASLEQAKIDAMAQRIVDAGLAGVDLSKIQIDGDAVTYWPYAPKPAFATMGLRIGELIAGADQRLAGDPAFFSPAFLEDVLNAPNGPATKTPLSKTWEIRKGADFAELMLVEFFGILRQNSQAANKRAFRIAYGSAAPISDDAAIEARVVEAQLDVTSGLASLMVGLCRNFDADPAVLPRIQKILAEPNGSSSP